MHTRYITDERTRIFNNSLHTIRRIDGHTKHGGCQCSRSCNCSETFISMKFTDYRVTKKWGNRRKTSTHSTKQAAYKQMRELTKAYKIWKNGITNPKAQEADNGLVSSPLKE